MAAAFEKLWGRPGRLKEMIIRITASGGASLSNGETDTGFDLPAAAIVKEVYVDVKTAEATGATKTIDVGILASESGGDADGLLDGIDVSSTGLKRGTLLNTGQTRGALMRADESGGGVLVPEDFVTSSITGKSVSVSVPNAFTEFQGNIHIWMLVFDD